MRNINFIIIIGTFSISALGFGQDTLTISSEKKSEVNVENEKFTRKEYNYNSFSRSFSLPETVDPETVAANYHNGILSVALPKKLVEVKSKVRQVEIL